MDATLFDDRMHDKRVIDTGKGEFPFVVYSGNAKVAAFSRDHRAVEYASWPERRMEAVGTTAESVIALCRAMPYDEGRNVLRAIVDRLDTEVEAWDAEPVVEPVVEVEKHSKGTP